MADAVPRIELAAAPVNSELRVFLGENRRLRGPKRMRRLQAVGGVAAAEFARLHDERGEKCREAEKKDGTTKE